MNTNCNNLPLDFQHPGGFVEKAMDYIKDTAVCPQPMFALGAALSLAGILYGRRVQSEDGQPQILFEGITRNDLRDGWLTRKAQFIRRNMREEYLADLIDGGEVVVRPFSDGHSHGENIFLNEFAHQA